MREIKLLMTLLVLTIIIHQVMAEDNKFFLRYKFCESQLHEDKDGIFGKSLVIIDSTRRCHAIYYMGTQNITPIYEQQVKEVEWVNKIDSSRYDSIYYGKCYNGTFFAEKLLLQRPTYERILFYNIPDDCYMKLMSRLHKSSFLPIELFRDSLLCLMGYKLSGASYESYEEGRYGGAFAAVDSARWCYVFYFNGAMMSTPLYHHQIKEIEYIHQLDSMQPDNKYYSQTGRLIYGKVSDGTYFVEKTFNQDMHGLPQGIIIFKIPEEYYKDMLQRLASLPSLPVELLW